MDVEAVRLKAEVMALRFVVVSLIEALPEAQKVTMCANLTSFAAASDSHKADFPAFSIGEEATNQMNDCLKQIVELVSQFQAIRSRAEAGQRPGLFNALFFGGMGRVSLKCHTPTQTAQ
jgi:hypothetical protein